MHTDLSPHLHTPECNLIITEFKACHEENKFKRWLGVCGDLESRLFKCIQNERKQNMEENARKGREKRERILNSL